MKPAKTTDPLPAWIDELGNVQKTLAPHRSLIEREKDLKDKIRRRYDDAAAAQAFEPEGKRFAAQIGARGWQRQITSMAKVFAVLKKAAFLKHCAMTLTALDRACDEAGCSELVTQVVTQEQVGPRGLKVIEKGKSA